MNADRLLAFYERIGDAPDAIVRLRRFILDLAVRGKLVEQDPNDEPASELLKRIAAEKARLVKAEVIKRPKQLRAVESDDTEFCIPSSWCWTRLGEVTSYIQRGKSPKYASKSGALVVSQKCVQWSGLNLNKARKITYQSLAAYEGIRFLREGDLLWNSTGTGTIGRVIRLIDPPERLVCDSHVTVVRCLLVSPEYIRTWLRTGNVYGLIEERAAGSTNQVELTAQMALNQVVPLPPLAEQHRIVAKVDELMALCDCLEVAQAEREATRDRLTAASLARLNAPDPDTDTFRNHAAFALENLTLLTTRLNQIKALRQTILNLAVRGKLVEQDRADEPASELLKRIAAEKAKLMKAGKFKTLDSDLPRDEAIFTFSVRSNWSWCYLDDLAAIARGGSPRPIKSYLTDDPNGIPWIKIGDSVRGNIYIDATKEKIRPEGLAKSRLVFPGDLLLSNSMSFGFPYMTNIEGCIHDGWLVIRTPDALINKLYLHSLFLSDHAKSAFFEAASGAVVQNLNADKARRLSVPLPPLAEQHRIVAKVDELMALCNRLEVSLATGDETRRRLLVALLHEAMSPNKKEIRQDISTIAKRTAGRTARIARSADRANAGRGVI